MAYDASKSKRTKDRTLYISVFRNGVFSDLRGRLWKIDRLTTAIDGKNSETGQTALTANF